MIVKFIKLLKIFIIVLMLTGMAYGATDNQRLILLLPDGQSLSDAKVTVWLDAIQEEGFPVIIMRDKKFIRAVAKGTKLRGIILPDQIHPQASDALIAAIDKYTSRGGKVMLTYDFGLRTDKGFYTAKSRFSFLAGLDYALEYPKTNFGPIVGMAGTMRQLQIPPGKTMDYTEKVPLAPVNLPWTAGVSSVSIHPPSSPQVISGYVYGITNYYTSITASDYNGTALLVSPHHGLAAGITDYENGKVLFVNIPLGFFAGATDAMLLRGFLYYFGAEILKLPRLAGLPDARGGMILNWHCDALEAQNPIGALDKMGVWDRGKFSIHFTAGPDKIKSGDGLGFDIANDPEMKECISILKKKGHVIGSHGGWIHDYYGGKAAENNKSEFLSYLVLNSETIKAITNETALEYSAPLGNNPQWAMDWLEQQGVISYYYTGDTGCGPRRSYNDGIMTNPKMWAFSVAPFGKYAVWDEFDTNGIDEKDVEKWYYALMDFVVNYRTARLIYMHPPYAQYHCSVLENLFDRADFYAAKGVFQWYTMAELGQFQTSRLKTNWKIIYNGGGNYRFEAAHPVNLATMAWLLPKESYKKKPLIIAGKGTIVSDAVDWIVTATEGKKFTFTAKLSK